MVLKNFGPTAMRSPVNASEKTGNMVPQNTTIRIAISTQLLSRKLASRDTIDSRRLVLRISLRRSSSTPR